jgi:hypothetical protein
MVINSAACKKIKRGGGLAWMYALGWSVFGELNFMDFGIWTPRSFRDLRDRISNGRAAGKIQPADRVG